VVSTEIETQASVHKSARRGEVLLKVDNLCKHFPIRRGVLSRVVGWVRAVDGVSFEVYRGETLGLVGESGCGKTTLSRAILRLTDVTSGSVTFDGVPVLEQNANDMRKLRKRMQIVFQDPYGSLNPRLTVGSMIAEAIKIHKLAAGDAVRGRVAELLDRVGIPAEYMNRTSSQAGSDSASASRAPWRSVQNSLLPTSPSAPSTCRFRPRSSTC
jgi:oligopeptide transport system ATP-binding protein